MKWETVRNWWSPIEWLWVFLLSVGAIGNLVIMACIVLEAVA